MSRIKVGGAKEVPNKSIKGNILWFLGGVLVCAGTMFVKNKISERIEMDNDDDDDFWEESEEEESSETTEE